MAFSSFSYLDLSSKTQNNQPFILLILPYFGSENRAGRFGPAR